MALIYSLFYQSKWRCFTCTLPFYPSSRSFLTNQEQLAQLATMATFLSLFEVIPYQQLPVAVSPAVEIVSIPLRGHSLPTQCRGNRRSQHFVSIPLRGHSLPTQHTLIEEKKHRVSIPLRGHSLPTDFFIQGLLHGSIVSIPLRGHSLPTRFTNRTGSVSSLFLSLFEVIPYQLYGLGADDENYGYVSIPLRGHSLPTMKNSRKINPA